MFSSRPGPFPRLFAAQRGREADIADEARVGAGVGVVVAERVVKGGVGGLTPPGEVVGDRGVHAARALGHGRVEDDPPLSEPLLTVLRDRAPATVPVLLSPQWRLGRELANGLGGRYLRGRGLLFHSPPSYPGPWDSREEGPRTTPTSGDYLVVVFRQVSAPRRHYVGGPPSPA